MSVCYAAVTGIKSGGSNEAGYNSVKVTSVSAKALSFYVSLDETASFFIIVFGKQLQWGEATTNTTTNFPISFAETAYSVIGVPCGTGGTDNLILEKFDKISVTFTMWKYTGKCYFIAAGQ